MSQMHPDNREHPDERQEFATDYSLAIAFLRDRDRLRAEGKPFPSDEMFMRMLTDALLSETRLATGCEKHTDFSSSAPSSASAPGTAPTPTNLADKLHSNALYLEQCFGDGFTPQEINAVTRNMRDAADALAGRSSTREPSELVARLRKHAGLMLAPDVKPAVRQLLNDAALAMADAADVLAASATRPTACPYCTSANEAIRGTYYDQTCEGCVKRMCTVA